MSNGKCASTRFGQIKKKLGYFEDGGAVQSPKSKTPRGKKTTGLGSKITPSKITKKPAAPRMGKRAKVDVQDESDVEVKTEVQDESGAEDFDAKPEFDVESDDDDDSDAFLNGDVVAEGAESPKVIGYTFVRKY